MKAAILDALGQLPRLGEFDEPDLLAGEQRVSVRCAPIKPLDRAIAAGRHYSSPKTLPVVCGMDGVGELADGSRVYFNTLRRPFGAMAERAPAALRVPVPAELDDALAAAVVNPALAAWLPLVWRGDMQPGETVLILGATGAAGKVAVKAARLLGAGKVIAAGRNQAVLHALGADATIDLRLSQEALAGQFAEHARHGIDVVVDYIWGPPVETLIQVLVSPDLAVASQSERGVRLVAVGEMAGSHIALPSGALRGSRLSLIGSGTGNFPPPSRMAAIISDIFRHTCDGALTVDVRRCPLEQVSEAWQQAAESSERIVLTV
ncbi:alcohol dehydrogenase [Alcanivorax hongdengensis A-11-3]|uniref:Alcohol dehydrogenase n=1 Tax=Alcanivorax hongdengensis A-11-3 TaxID=1177179 RepID=L0WCR5_9GAMM|nr:zinc-binding alcohol dehydrogenase family protein [Alcanivorax hongdengensis]EKF74794.1 alcohol dehydrogenase [Alcanivorax hongdengensis A-11-3]